MVWSAVVFDVSKSRLVFIDEGLKVNSQVCLNMLQTKVLTCLTETFENKKIFIQYDASAHKATFEPLAVSEAELDGIRRVSGQAIVDTLKLLC